MIVFDDIENRRKVLNLVATGIVQTSRIKQLQYNEDLNYLDNCLYDEVDLYITDLSKTTNAQLNYLLDVLRVKEDEINRLYEKILGEVI